MSTHAALSWTDPEHFRIRWPIQEGQDATEEVSVALEADGWKVYYQNKPVLQSIIGYSSIRFANDVPGKREFLGTLKVGKRVYTDHDYLFTDLTLGDCHLSEQA